MPPAVQLERTIWHALDWFGTNLPGRTYTPSDDERFGHLRLGVIMRRHRLFNVGDVVVVELNNGGGERWPVTGVSSKGRRVNSMYLHFQAWPGHGSHRRRNGTYRCGFRQPSQPERVTRDAAIVEHSGHPVKFLEVVQSWPADPASQQAIVELLRAGAAVWR